MLRNLHRLLINLSNRATYTTLVSSTQKVRSMAQSAYLHKVLSENSTERYTIEYNGFYSNHLSHGLIALDRLGASETRLDRFVEWYCKRLELPTEEEKSENGDTQMVQSLLGKETSFYAILQHYKNLLDTEYGTIDKLIAAEFPKLSSGIAGAAFHGAIQLGYGYAAKHEETVLEGLAYLHHAYRPIVPTSPGQWQEEFGTGDTDVLDVFASIGNGSPLHGAMLEGEKQITRNDKRTSYFQKRGDYLLTQKADALIDLAKSVKLPASVYENGVLDPTKLAKQILDWSVLVYTVSQVPNEFFLLHGVTCTWALSQLLSALSREDALKMLAELFVGIEYTYLAENSPKLSGKLDAGLQVTHDAWAGLIKEAIDVDRDEHIYKLVQVCYELSKESGHSNPLYLQAASSSLSSPLNFPY